MQQADSVAIEAGRVLLGKKRPAIGLLVQCTEYIPAQIASYVTLPERCTRVRIRALRTHLPNGEMVGTSSAGYVLDLALFDKSLAVAAHRAGAEVWTGARAIEQEAGDKKQGNGIRVRIKRG